MRSLNNNVFTAIQALFDETLFPKCPNMCHPGYTPVGLPPDDLQGEHNRPLDGENGEHGGGLPPIPVRPAGGQVPWQHMQPQQPPLQPPQQQQHFAYPPLPPSQPSSCSSSRLSYMDPSPWITSRDLLHQGIKLILRNIGILVHGETLMCALHHQNYGGHGMIGFLISGGLMAVPQRRIIILD
jgi:hypothetical protein